MTVNKTICVIDNSLRDLDGFAKFLKGEDEVDFLRVLNNMRKASEDLTKTAKRIKGKIKEPCFS